MPAIMLTMPEKACFLVNKLVNDGHEIAMVIMLPMRGDNFVASVPTDGSAHVRNIYLLYGALIAYAQAAGMSNQVTAMLSPSLMEQGKKSF